MEKILRGSKRLGNQKFYGFCLRRLSQGGVDKALAARVAQVLTYVDGSRRRSSYENYLVTVAQQQYNRANQL